MPANTNDTTKPKKTLTEVMEKVTNKKMTAEELAELEKTADFKALSQNAKDEIRLNGGVIDKEMSDIDKAIERTNTEIVDAVNKEREKQGQEELTMVDFITKNPNDVKADEVAIVDDVESEFSKQMLELTGETPDAQVEETEEELEEKQLRLFERQLENAMPATFIAPAVVPAADSAALSIKVKRNTAYEDNMKTVLTDNNITFRTNKKASIKSALLRDFILRLPHVTTPLINSGFHITLSGAAIPEIIQMNSLTGKKRSELEIKKIGFIVKHIVDSSIGTRLSVTQLMKSVFYKDLQTLYFNLFIGSFPDENEFPVLCENEKCGIDVKLTIHAADMVLNAHEFEDESKYILYQNTDISDVLMYSKVAKEKEVVLKNKMMIVFRNPTLFDVTLLSTIIENSKIKNIADYSRVIGYLTFIKSISLPDGEGQYVQYIEPEEMLELLTALDEYTLDDIDSHVEEYTITNTVKYGLKAWKCPKCGKLHQQKEMELADFLFTMSQIRQMLMMLAKLKKKKDTLPE